MSSKIFCIGFNKTGTTSLEAALSAMGYSLGQVPEGEILIDAWSRRDFQPIIDFCQSAEAFQDVPFSLEFTFAALDQAFPGSRFILTVRGNAQEWYRSLTRFHSKIVGKGRLPKQEDLQSFNYRHPGWLLKWHQLVFGVDDKTLYDEHIYISCYQRHIDSVRSYFKHRPKDLLVLNVAHDRSMADLYEFLGREWDGSRMPHLKKTSGV